MEPPYKRQKLSLIGFCQPVCIVPPKVSKRSSLPRGTRTIVSVLDKILKKVVRQSELRHKKRQTAWGRMTVSLLKRERIRNRACRRHWKRWMKSMRTYHRKRIRHWRALLSKWRSVVEIARKAKLAAERANRHPLEQRKFDTAKHVELHYISKHLEPYNVPFDDAAKLKKQEIFGEYWKTTCVWSGDCLRKGLSVDHVFPVRNAYGNEKNHKTGWHDGGLRGGNSEWNTIMVRKEKNSGFKIFDYSKTYGWKKNIGWQVLTPQEESQCDARQFRLYSKIKRWRRYCELRGARYCWRFNRQMNLDLAATYEAVYREIVRRENEMKQHVHAILLNTATLNYPTI